MSDDVFPIGRYSRNDVESDLNNTIDTTFQLSNSLQGATFGKSFYGMGYFIGTGAASVLDKWISFNKPIPNVISVFTQFVGLTGMTNPSAITSLTMPAFDSIPAPVISVAGLQQAGFTARMSSSNVVTLSGNFLNNSAYVFNWHVIASVR